METTSELPFEIKRVKPNASLSASKPAPLEVGEEVVLDVRSTGFVDPSFEVRISKVKFISIGKRFLFPIDNQDKGSDVLEKSESGDWRWTPREDGIYKISLSVVDESEKTHTTRYFLILRKEELKNIKRKVSHE